MAAPRHRWFVFGAMAGVYLSFGVAVTAIAPMLTEVRTDLGVSRGAIPPYLDSVVRGVAHYVETGDPVTRNQFGAHPIYSPAVS